MHESILINVTEKFLGNGGRDTIKMAILSQDPSVIEVVIVTLDDITIKINEGYDTFDENTGGHITGDYSPSVVTYQNSKEMTEKMRNLDNHKRFTISQHFTQFFIKLDWIEQTCSIVNISKDGI